MNLRIERVVGRRHGGRQCCGRLHQLSDLRLVVRRIEAVRELLQRGRPFAMRDPEQPRGGIIVVRRGDPVGPVQLRAAPGKQSGVSS